MRGDAVSPHHAPARARHAGAFPRNALVYRCGDGAVSGREEPRGDRRGLVRTTLSRGAHAAVVAAWRADGQRHRALPRGLLCEVD